MYDAGNLAQKKRIIRHVLNNEHVIVHGAHGTGKSLFLTQTRFNGYSVSRIECYDKDEVHSRHFLALFTVNSVFERKRVIILDNFDTVDGKIQSLLSGLVKQSLFPVVMVCNEISKIYKSMRDISYEVYFDKLNKDELFRLMSWWKEQGLIKEIKDVYLVFDGDVMRLKNNYEGYEDMEPATEKMKMPARAIAAHVFSDETMDEKFKMLFDNRERIKTVLEYMSSAILTAYASIQKLSVAMDTVSFINSKLYEIKVDYAIGLLLCLPKNDYPPRLKYVKVESIKKSEDEYVDR